jgi:signal transduction histidine kinase
VSVSVIGRPTSIELHVIDNGTGFDVEKTLVKAARDGRFGLIGLHERARLLGGASNIDSRPGRSTTISVTLPRWRPIAPESE